MAVVHHHYDHASKKEVLSDHCDSGFIDNEGLCHVCGDRMSDAMWCCAQNIQVCQYCALEVLPKLMADSVVGNLKRQQFPRKSTHLAGIKAMEKAKAAFWYAYGVALESVLSKNNDREDEDSHV